MLNEVPMRHRHTIYFSALLVLLGLSACSVSTLRLSEEKDILVTHANAVAVIKTRSLANDSLNASPVTVYRETLRSGSGNLLVYETTDIDDRYVYTYATPRTISLLFDAREVRTLYVSNNLHFFQLGLRSGGFLNIAVQQSGDQSLSFVYGFSAAQFAALVGQLTKPGETLMREPESGVLLLEEPLNAVKSRWSFEKLFIAPLVSPAPHRSMH